MRCAIIDLSSNVVVNIVDGAPSGAPPGYPGCISVADTMAQTGWIWNGTSLSIPVHPGISVSEAIFSSSAFRALFTSAELNALTTLAQTNAVIARFLSDVNAAGSVTLTGDLAVNGMRAIVGLSPVIVSTARAAQILSGQPPL